ncbi:histidine triad nucleotide-binding protein [Paenibacillus physcomitrellae]|uniref:Histidine triad nucleotide-binding protein n=1 Tax=Paenibacillus physcomitrellae TaxID=1619311 RepID=A0ABQ1FM14_9BACL|nr:histidine triad nucleotide-binding protein [Paenibacillus physcomitrellae]GGA20435.1 histidine triad nucleotide-binding protein [Paenibacillus physcomitrellae]
MENCLFCKIVNGDIPSNKIYEDDEFLVFHDIQPAAPVHAVMIPKKHIASMNEAEGEDFALIGKLHQVAQTTAKQLDIAETGYRLINNCGPDGGQTVFHLHFHLLGGAKLGALTGVSASHAE